MIITHTNINTNNNNNAKKNNSNHRTKKNEPELKIPGLGHLRELTKDCPTNLS